MKKILEEQIRQIKLIIAQTDCDLPGTYAFIGEIKENEGFRTIDYDFWGESLFRCVFADEKHHDRIVEWAVKQGCELKTAESVYKRLCRYCTGKEDLSGYGDSIT